MAIDIKDIRSRAKAASESLEKVKVDPELRAKLRAKRVREMHVALVDNFRDEMVELVALAGKNSEAAATDQYKALKAGIEAAKPGGVVLNHAEDVMQLCDWAEKYAKTPEATPAK